MGRNMHVHCIVVEVGIGNTMWQWVVEPSKLRRCLLVCAVAYTTHVHRYVMLSDIALMYRNRGVEIVRLYTGRRFRLPTTNYNIC